MINLTKIDTPLGLMVSCANEEGICLLEFSDRKMLPAEFATLTKRFKTNIEESENKHFEILRKELNEYFQRTRKEFTVPLSISGSPFQKRAWDALMSIPYGKTVSYIQQAKNLGNPDSVRAVANANGMNCIAIIIPCHRVIGSDGHLTGYGGGLWRKKWLLDLENEYREPELFSESETTNFYPDSNPG
jgi:AraC family transcriptional regulator of adaptative response/methylated-DNA-[protein]-cysteine methyltransferase